MVSWLLIDYFYFHILYIWYLKILDDIFPSIYWINKMILVLKNNLWQIILTSKGSGHGRYIWVHFDSFLWHPAWLLFSMVSLRLSAFFLLGFSSFPSQLSRLSSIYPFHSILFPPSPLHFYPLPYSRRLFHCVLTPSVYRVPQHSSVYILKLIALIRKPIKSYDCNSANPVHSWCFPRMVKNYLQKPVPNWQWAITYSRDSSDHNYFQNAEVHTDYLPQ